MTIVFVCEELVVNASILLLPYSAPTAPTAGVMQDNARPHTARMSQDCLLTVTALPWPSRPPEFVSNRAYMGSFGTASWASNEFERTRGKVTANMERNVSSYRTYAAMPDLIASCIRTRGGSTGVNPQVYVETPLHPEKLFGALYGLVESFFKNDEGHNVTVNGDRYRAMITNFFIPELNNHDVQELWFQQDGATCHTARATID
ncbi:uncharacterized protein TNCV_792161 [Trichonephila clavipes]|nr:uncharacterized protein TNCV_792161 [Trichonephila clavipes]